MDIGKLRAETTGCQHVTHFNNAGASLMPDPVTSTVISYLEEESRIGGYETAARRNEEIKGIYDAVAKLINAKPKEIALQENATMAWNMAFFSIGFEPGDRILTSVSEYASNYISYLKLQETIDVEIEIIPNDKFGQTSVSSLKKMLDDSVKLIGITHIPTNSGLVNPAEDIGRVARKNNILYLLDACQSTGQYPLDVKKLGCDMLSATGRKYLRGPRGTGFLYVKSDVINSLSPPFVDLHAAQWVQKDKFEIHENAKRFETWENNYAALAGLKKAVEYALDLGMNEIRERIQYLAGMLRDKLSNVPEVTVRDIGKIKGGIVTFTFDGKSATEIKSILHRNNINVSVSTRNSTRIDMEIRDLKELVRISVHYFNTTEELDKLTAVLKSI